MTVCGNMASVMGLCSCFPVGGLEDFWGYLCSTFRVCIYKKKVLIFFILYYVTVYIILGVLLLCKRY